VNSAISVIAEFMVIVWFGLVPVKLPVPVPVQDLNLWPAFAVALIVTVWPALYQSVLVVTDPGPLTFMVRKYSCWNANTMVVTDALPVNGWFEYHR